MKTLSKASFLFAMATMAISTSAHAAGLIGVNAVVTNTFQADETDNHEVDVSAFNLVNNIFFTVSDAVELSDFLTIYHIDISQDAVRFTWTESEFSNSISGKMSPDKHDRNYFIFDLPEGVEIKTVEFDPETSELLENSALPTIRRISGNRIVTEFGNGVIRGVGFNPSYKISVGPAEN